MTVEYLETQIYNLGDLIQPHPILYPYCELHLSLCFVQAMMLDDLLLEYLHRFNEEPNVCFLVFEVLGVARQGHQILHGISPFTYWIILRVELQIVQLD